MMYARNRPWSLITLRTFHAMVTASCSRRRIKAGTGVEQVAPVDSRRPYTVILAPRARRQ